MTAPAAPGVTGTPAVTRALPRLLLLTDRSLAPLVGAVREAVAAGLRAVVLREKDLPAPERLRLADALAGLLEPVGGLLVLAGGAARSADPARDALHLAAAEPVPALRPALLGRSCHDAAEVARAAAEGCDWVTVSPVHLTASKPGHGPALGPDGLARLVRPGLPAYALGGVEPQSVPACVQAGAYGVAVMGGVLRAERPGRVVEALLRELP